MSETNTKSALIINGGHIQSYTDVDSGERFYEIKDIANTFGVHPNAVTDELGLPGNVSVINANHVEAFLLQQCMDAVSALQDFRKYITE